MFYLGMNSQKVFVEFIDKLTHNCIDEDKQRRGRSVIFTIHSDVEDDETLVQFMEDIADVRSYLS